MPLRQELVEILKKLPGLSDENASNRKIAAQYLLELNEREVDIDWVTGGLEAALYRLVNKQATDKKIRDVGETGQTHVVKWLTKLQTSQGKFDQQLNNAFGEICEKAKRLDLWVQEFGVEQARRKALWINKYVLPVVILVTASIILFFVYVLVNENTEFLLDDCAISSKKEMRRINLAFLGIGTSLKDADVQFLTRSKANINNLTERYLKDAILKIKDEKSRFDFQILSPKLGSKGSLEEFRQCADKIFRNWATDNGLVAFAYLEDLPGGQEQQLIVEYKTSFTFLSDRRDYYINELASQGRLGAPIRIRRNAWRGGTAQLEDNGGKQLALRLTALVLMTEGVNRLGKGEFDNAQELLHLALRELEDKNNQTFSGAKTIELFLAWNKLQIARQTKNLRLLEEAKADYDTLLNSLDKDITSYNKNGDTQAAEEGRGLSCRVLLGRANVEYFHLLLKQDFSDMSEQYPKYIQYFDQAENCWKKLSNNQQELLTNAELPAKIDVGRSQLAILNACVNRDQTLFDFARFKLRQLTEIYERLPSTGNFRIEERKNSLRPWAAHAYGVLGGLILWDVNNNCNEVVTANFDEAFSLYTKALELSIPALERIGISAQGYNWQRFYLAQQAYIRCRQNRYDEALNFFRSVRKLVADDGSLDKDIREALFSELDQLEGLAVNRRCQPPILSTEITTTETSLTEINSIFKEDSERGINR
jgi:tetratricopeptide (TPR) repeat protein